MELEPRIVKTELKLIELEVKVKLLQETIKELVTYLNDNRLRYLSAGVLTRKPHAYIND